MTWSDPRVGKNKAATMGRTRERQESKAWEPGFTRVPEIATAGGRGGPDLGLAVGMPRREEMKEDCGQGACRAGSHRNMGKSSTGYRNGGGDVLGPTRQGGNTVKC